jgi:hypothetical protein
VRVAVATDFQPGTWRPKTKFSGSVRCRCRSRIPRSG